jgi:hypothetical protein
VVRCQRTSVWHPITVSAAPIPPNTGVAAIVHVRRAGYRSPFRLARIPGRLPTAAPNAERHIACGLEQPRRVANAAAAPAFPKYEPVCQPTTRGASGGGKQRPKRPWPSAALPASQNANPSVAAVTRVPNPAATPPAVAPTKSSLVDAPSGFIGGGSTVREMYCAETGEAPSSTKSRIWRASDLMLDDRLTRPRIPYVGDVDRARVRPSPSRWALAEPGVASP